MNTLVLSVPLVTLSIPGSTAETLAGGNASGQFAGTYTGAGGVEHGYVYDVHAATYSFIDFPGADATRVTGINAAGDIVGEWDIGTAVLGFSRIGGAYALILPPGAQGAYGLRINDAGQIAGTAIDGAGYGFLLDHGSFTTIDPPGAVQTQLLALGPSGEVAGTHREPGAFPGHGPLDFFVHTSGTYTELPAPDGMFVNDIAGIDAAGAVAGQLFSPATGISGFVYASGTITIRNVPGAQDTLPHGITADGRLYGSFFPGDVEAAPQGYVETEAGITQIGMAGASFTTVEAMLPDGTLAGRYALADGRSHVYVGAIACYAAGTRIATPAGETPIERLRVGDRVLSAFGGTATISWLGHRDVACDARPHPEQSWPIRIRAGALADNVPHRDLLVSPDHGILVDGALVPAALLANGITIAQERHDRITWWHLELPAHDAVLAEGAPAETYLDTGNRAAFTAAGPTRQGCPASIWQAEACAPQLRAGPALAAIRSTLAKRASLLAPLTPA